MRVATVDGLVTLFYDGSKLLYSEELEDEFFDATGSVEFNDADLDDLENDISDTCMEYFKERSSWQQIIILDGVKVIPRRTFSRCYNIKRVMVANTVIRIEQSAFFRCERLSFIGLSINLEFIGECAFYKCDFFSVFIPSSCRVIEQHSFYDNENLQIFHVPHHTHIESHGLSYTKLIEMSPFHHDFLGNYAKEAHNWVKNVNTDDRYALHKICCSHQPSIQNIYNIIREKGIGAFHKENMTGITPSKYLEENSFADVTEFEIIRSFTMKMIKQYSHMNK